jgi:hypothetical protein
VLAAIAKSTEPKAMRPKKRKCFRTWGANLVAILAVIRSRVHPCCQGVRAWDKERCNAVVGAKQERRVCIGDGAFFDRSWGHEFDPGRSNFPARGFESVVNRGVENRLLSQARRVPAWAFRASA